MKAMFRYLFMKMSKVFVSFGFVLGLFHSDFVSADVEEVKTVRTQEPFLNLSVDPVSLLSHYFDVGADLKFSSTVTVGAYLDFSSYGLTSDYRSRTFSYRSREVLAFGGGVRMHFYLNNDAFSNGWYVSPFIGFVPVSTLSTITSIFNYGTLAGYQWTLPSGINIRLAAGGRYVYIDSSSTDTYLHGIAPMAEFRLGYSL